MTFLFNLDDFNNDYIEKQNLIYNFYMPLNEIFFFLFGTILISFGYKYKLRLDYIIIGIILIMFILKIALFTHYYQKSQIYTRRSFR